MAAEELHHPDAARIELVDVLAALGHPARLEIVRALVASGPGADVFCGEVVPDLPRSSVTHHLRTLREAGVICQRREGRKLFLTLRRDDLDRLFPGLIAMVVEFPAPGPAVGPGL
jgi:DNA-binding transcriptional ArsR family regulator